MKFFRIAAMILALTLSLCMLAGCSGNEADSGMIGATIVIVLEDGSEIMGIGEFKRGLTIREALYDADMIDNENRVSEYITTIDGYTADFEEGAFWDIQDAKGNPIEPVGEGLAIDTVELKQGDTIQFVYTVIPDFDD